MAEFESDLIRSRTVEGMREAAKRGRLLGKPSKLSVLPRRRLLADYESGEYSAAPLMDISGLSRSAMYATLNKAREEHRGSREHRYGMSVRFGFSWVRERFGDCGRYSFEFCAHWSPPPPLGVQLSCPLFRGQSTPHAVGLLGL